jgi:hypothetical protein
VGSPLVVFISCAAKDDGLRDELVSHLAALVQRGVIAVWHTGLVGPGGDLGKERDAHLRSAGLVVLLVSADYLASDDLRDGEMTPSLDRARQDGTRVVPVLGRPLDWEKAPFSGLALLPRSKLAVTSWANRDEAWAEVVAGLRKVIEGGDHEATSAAGTPNNLRARNPYFRGRGVELAALEAVLRREKKATITHASVFGLGGVGKTALALELAHRAVDGGNYPGGVWWECVATWILGAVEPRQTRAEMEAVDARREHIDEALGAAKRIGSGLVWIRIANMLAIHVRNRARYDESLALFQQALALVYKDVGQPAAARPLYERAIAIAEARLPPDHPHLALYRKRLAALGPPR